MTQTCISPREKEVLDLIVDENSTKMIARELFISEHTVISHRKNLMTKLNASNAAGLVRRAYESGVLNLSRQVALFVLISLSVSSVKAQQTVVEHNSTFDNPHLELHEESDSSSLITFSNNQFADNRFFIKADPSTTGGVNALLRVGWTDMTSASDILNIDATENNIGINTLPDEDFGIYAVPEANQDAAHFGEFTAGSTGFVTINSPNGMPSAVTSILRLRANNNIIADFFDAQGEIRFEAPLEMRDRIDVFNADVELRGSTPGNFITEGNVEATDGVFSGTVEIENEVIVGTFDSSPRPSISVGGPEISSTGGFMLNNRLTVNRDIIPLNDNEVSLGEMGARWTEVWAMNGTIETSDKRAKKNINSSIYGLQDVLKLNPVMYNWKSDEDNQEKTIGLIAQELLEVIPEVVRVPEDKEDLMGVKYSELTPVLIKAIQEQQAIIESQNDIIISLRDDVAIIHATLSELAEANTEDSAQSED